MKKKNLSGLFHFLSQRTTALQLRTRLKTKIWNRFVIKLLNFFMVSEFIFHR